MEYDSHLAEDDCYVCHEVYKYCRGLSSTNEEVSPTNVVDGINLINLCNNKIKSNSVDTFDAQLIIAKKNEKNSKIDEAINIYEECVQLKCEDNIPYDRLIILYRKKRQKENEIRILKSAIEIFKKDDNYQVRLSKIAP